MATRNLRNRTGASRLSSPAVGHVESGTNDPIAVATAPLLEAADEEDDGGEWREPTVRVLPPSFKDHKGVERIGVLELQQPLDVRPSAKLLQRLKLTFNRPSNRGTPLPDDEVISQAGAGSEVAENEIESPMDVEPATALEEDGADQMLISSPPRGRPSNRDMAAMQAAYNPAEMTPSPTKEGFEGTPSAAQQDPNTSKPTSIQEHLRQERVQNYITKAVNEAQDRGDWGLVPGLEKIRRNANGKRDLWMILEAVAHQNPTPEQLHIFKKFIKRGLHKYRREVMQSDGASKPFLGIDNGVDDAIAGGDLSQLTSPTRTRKTTGQLHDKGASTRRRRSSRRLQEANADTEDRTPRRRRARSNASHSSTSSLSSIKSISSANSEQEWSDAAGPPPAVISEGVGSDGRQASSAALRLRLVNKNSASLPPSDTTTEINPISSKVISEKLRKTQQAREEAEQEAADIEKRRKRLIKESFNDYNYIERTTVNERHQSQQAEDDDEFTSHKPVLPPPAPVIHSESIGERPNPSAWNPMPEDALPRQNLMNGTSRKRGYDEYAESDDESEPLTPLSSSPAPTYDPPPPPPNAVISRSATPRFSTRNSGPPAKMARKSARVMISPNKPKNGGLVAGFSRAGPPSRMAELGSGPASSQEDNDEFCASCGGEGTLLCCDGCTNSFHHDCLEPPLDPSDDVDGEWFCPQCVYKRKKSTEESKTFLGRPLAALDHAIPRAFALPDTIRGYFEGVRTGEEGEYVEHSLPRTHHQGGVPKFNKAGLIEEPNYKDPRDSKGNFNTCKGCGLGTNGKDLVPCDYCDASWHLDCVDPPMSVPPRRRIDDKPNSTWRCPLHVEQDLAVFGRQIYAGPGDLGGVCRRRKPKNAKPIDTDFPRGFRNNGLIEVELEDVEPPIREVDMDGHVFRLPEQAIKLDFIDRVKRSWYEDKTLPYTANNRRPPRLVQRDYRPTSGTVLHPPAQTTITIKEPEFYKGAQALSIVETAKANAHLRRKTLPEQQAVLSLTKMAKSEEGEVYGDALADLTNALISEAPEQVESIVNRDERSSLQHIRSLINRRLQVLEYGDVDLPQQQRGRASNRGGRRESATANNRGGGLRELQPAPYPNMPQYAYAQPYTLDPNLPNGHHYAIPYYHAGPPPPPPQQQQQQSGYAYAAPYPPPGSAYGEWAAAASNASRQAPLQQNLSPWRPPGPDASQGFFAQGQQGQQEGVTNASGNSAESQQQAAESKTASLPATPGGSSQMYGPRPPQSMSSDMQRQSSAAGAGAGHPNGNGNGEYGRRTSLPGSAKSMSTPNQPSEPSANASLHLAADTAMANGTPTAQQSTAMLAPRTAATHDTNKSAWSVNAERAPSTANDNGGDIDMQDVDATAIDPALFASSGSDDVVGEGMAASAAHNSLDEETSQRDQATAQKAEETNIFSATAAAAAAQALRMANEAS